MEWDTRSSERMVMRMGKTARPFCFGVRFKEHNNVTRSSRTAVGDHLKNTARELPGNHFFYDSNKRRHLQKKTS